MPVDLLNYQGNAGLGLGSNPDINVGAIDTKVVNDTMRNISLLDNERNMKIFQQKVKDRDNLEALILGNQVSTGEIDPKDQPAFDKQKGEVEKSYQEWGGNFNDTAGFRKYQSAVSELQNTATHAQTRWAGIKKLEQEKSQQTIPWKIKAYDQHIKEQEAKPFGEQITPYQQLHDFSIDDVTSGVNPIKGSIIDPNNPVSYDTSTVDFGDILKNKENDYLNNQDKRDSYDQFYDKLAKYNQPELQKTISAMDAKIAKYNSERGFKQGDSGYVDPVKTHKNDDGTVVLAEPKTSLVAKYALANQESFVTKTPKYNKDIAKGGYDKARLQLEEERNQIAARKVGVEAAKANAYIKHENAATKKILTDYQKEGTDVSKMYNDFVDNLTPGGLTLTDKESGSASYQDAVYTDQLPAGYQYINGAVVNDKSGKVTAGRLVPYTTNNKKGPTRPYYIPHYVNAQTGEKITPDSEFINSTFKQWKDSGFKGDKAQMMKTLIKNGALDLTLQGKNGTVNASAMSSAARVMNNQAGSKKGEENIINPPESEPDAPEPNNQPESNPDNN
jgi:hypothetical protein